MLSQPRPVPLAENLQKALEKDFFVPILVTSQTRGKFKSLNLPFGLGKTTFSLKLSYVLHGGSPDFEDMECWNEVFDHMKYYPSKLIKLLLPSDKPKPKIPCAIWDATQLTAPADQSVPKVIRQMAAILTENRPEVSCLIMNAPNMNMIARPLRTLAAYECIVYERGHYEVQQITYHKNFHDPTQDLVRLSFVEGTDADNPSERATAFEPLPDDIQKRYNEWRAKEKEPYMRSAIKRLVAYEDKLEGKDEEEETKEITFSQTCAFCGYQWNPSRGRTKAGRCPSCSKRQP